VIDTWFENNFYLTFFTENLVDSSNYENPISTSRGIMVNKAESVIGKKVNIELQKIIYETDSGWLTSSISTEVTAAVGKQDLDTGKDPSVGGEFSVLLTLTGRQVKYQRSYMKIQELLANITGLISTIMTIVLILNTPYATHKYYENITN